MSDEMQSAIAKALKSGSELASLVLGHRIKWDELKEKALEHRADLEVVNDLRR